MSIVSRPALGQQCLTPSAFGSGNLSQAGGGGQPCTGATPAFWAQDQHLSSWPPPYTATAPQQKDAKKDGSVSLKAQGPQVTYFAGALNYAGPIFKGRTMLQVL